MHIPCQRDWVRANRVDSPLDGRIRDSIAPLWCVNALRTIKVHQQTLLPNHRC